ncbi:MAG: alpha/beta hydrolase [Patescibacteria group bacterium]
MAKQIVIIHGGSAQNSYEEYVERLRTREVTIDDFKKHKGWKDFIVSELGNDWEMLTPEMPSKKNAKYLEWKIWFERMLPFIEDGAVFIGHSLGGLFLAKYLSEETYPKSIRATILVAAPYNTLTEHPRADFNITKPLRGLEEQGGEVFLYHSPDDTVVPLSNFEHYRNDLPGAHAIVLEGRGHFNEPTFPELVEKILEMD